MKKLSAWAVLAALAASITFCGFRAAAQAPAVRSGPPIVLLDIGHVYKNHRRFKSGMDALKVKVDQAEAQVKSEKEAVRKMTEELQRFKSGTLEYKQLEERIANRVAQVETRVRLQKRDFLQEEAKIYHNAYLEIQDVVNYYISTGAATIVLRFSRDPVEPDDPNGVIKQINKPVIGHHAQLDITDWVLSQLNRDNPAPATPRTSRGGTTPVPFNNRR